MKVLHVSPYMHPAAGGPPVVVERYCQLSRNHGWEARVITTSLLCDDNGRELERALSAQIQAEVLPVDRPRLLGLSSGAHAAIDAAVRTSDIVHLHTLWHPLGAMVRKAARKHDRPYLTMPHGMLDSYSLSVNAWRKRIYLHLVERANLGSAQKIVYTSEEEQHLAVEAFPWLPPGMLTPLGADDPPDMVREQLRQDFLSRYPVATGRRCLLFLGRLHPKKGLDRILEVLPSLADRFPDILLIVTGAGDPDYTKALQRRVRAQGLEDRVFFTGLLQGELKWSAFSMAEAFILPSRQENFAISVAEAMRMGVPVVITDRVHSSSYVEEAKAGIVLRGDSLEQSLLEGVTGLLEDVDAAREMGEDGKNYAARNLTWQTATQRIIACYESVLGVSSQDRKAAFGTMRSVTL